MLIEFRGWIPTVTGNLSFSTIGNGRYPPKRFKLFREFDGSSRFTVVAQEQRTSDALFGRFGEFLNSLKGRVSRFVFVYLGTCTERDSYKSIRGPVFIMTLGAFRTIEPELEELKSKSTLDDFAEHFSKVINQLDDNSGVLAKCGSDLLRNGQHTIAFASNSNQVELLASQVHFFLRDICHMHQHHEPTSDTILDVYPVSKGPLYWKKETAYALFRWIIQRKRTRSPRDIASAKGVLAYADAFKALHINGTRGEHLLPVYMSAPLGASLDAVLATNELKSEGEKNASDGFYARFLPLLFGLLSVFALYISPGSTSAQNWQTELFSKFAQAIRDYPFNAALILFVFPYVAMLWRRGRQRKWRREWARDFYRLTLAMPKYLVVCVTVLVVVGLCFWIFGLASDEIIPNRLHPSGRP